MRKILITLLALMLAFTSAVALADGQIRVGMECDYAPFNWTQTEETEYSVPIEGGMGYADGYDVQIAKKIAEGLGMELVIVKTVWEGLPVGVQSGALDAIIAGMSPTAERKATLDFSDPYYRSELVIVVRKDSKYASATKLSDFSGAVITGQIDTVHYDVIPQIPGVIQDSAREDFPAMIIATRSGVVDGYVAERPGAEADTMANPDLTFISFAEGEGFTASDDDVAVAVGLQKGSPLVDAINEILAGIDDDTRNQLMREAQLRQPLIQE